jgi:pilus assembly protein Flp/PilA
MIELSTGRSASGIAALRLSLAHPSKDLRMHKLINRFRRDEEGAALVEYGMLVGLIAVICVAAVTLLGQEVSTAFSIIAASLASI